MQNCTIKYRWIVVVAMSIMATYGSATAQSAAARHSIEAALSKQTAALTEAESSAAKSRQSATAAERTATANVNGAEVCGSVAATNSAVNKNGNADTERTIAEPVAYNQTATADNATIAQTSGEDNTHGDTQSDTQGNAQSKKQVNTQSNTQKYLFAKLYFRNNSSTIDSTYMDNAKAIATLREMIAKQDTCRVELRGSASPVGTEKYNRELSHRRAEAASSLIAKLGGNRNMQISKTFIGEDWETFTADIEHGYHRVNRNRVLGILYSDNSNAMKKRMLQSLDEGATYRYLVRNYMRNSRQTLCAFTLPAFGEPILGSTEFAGNGCGYGLFAAPSLDGSLTPDRPACGESDSYRRRLVVALRNNLLLLPFNIGIEIPAGNRWSVGLDYYFPWFWPAGRNRRSFEMLSWEVEGRYWFGRNRTEADRLTGHSMALYAGFGYYDFQRNYKGHQGEYMNIGIDYCYAIPVAKGKLHFEFSVGVGYIYSWARPYTVHNDYGQLISNRQKKHIGWIGPTKANISLVVPIYKRIPTAKQR